MTNRFPQWLRDWRRGFSDEELRAAKAKLLMGAAGAPGSVTELSNAEMRAVLWNAKNSHHWPKHAL